MLAAILRQNPAFHAAMSSPLYTVIHGLLRNLGPVNEYSRFISDEQRERILRSVFESFYCSLSDRKVIFDTSRGWTGQLFTLAALFGESRVVCCVRSPAWILDSIERRVQSSPFQRSKMFTDETGVNVYTRVEHMLKKGILGPSLQGLRQAWYGEHADRLIVVRYESLTEQPAEVIGQLYRALGEPEFEHDFEKLEYDAPEFDQDLGMPGLHRVRRRIEPNRRTTVLPPDLFSQNDRSFWDVPGQNPQGVLVL